MNDLTDDGRRAIAEIATRYGLSLEAVEQMARAVAQGGGTMAQFNIPELGGSGQWMAGGMTMVGDMFNHGLQAQVSGLCVDLANAQSAAPFFKRVAGSAGDWWPRELGQPSAVGGQNDMRYAYFPQARRVAVDPGGGRPVRVLDSLDHQIGGFSQQQQGQGDLFQGVSFSSQYGQFALSSLPPAPEYAPAPPAAPTPVEPAPVQSSIRDLPPPAQQAMEPAPLVAEPSPLTPAPQPATTGMVAADLDAVLGAIERLAALRDKGALTDQEFAAKKTELLARL